MTSKRQTSAPPSRKIFIAFNSETADGRYADLCQFAEDNADTYGSSVNALAQAIRKSPLYLAWKEALDELAGAHRREVSKQRRTAG